MNARLSCNKIPEIQHFIIDRNLDLCTITETWIKQSHILNTLPREVYFIKYSPRYSQTGGGIAMVNLSDLAFD